MGEKEGILQFVFHSLMIRQQPRHVACLECLHGSSPLDFTSLSVSRWTMRMLVQLVLGLFVLKAVVASPRFSRQVDLDTYDSTNYDVDLDNFNLENQDIYDYEDGLTIDDPQVRNCIGQSVSTRENGQIPSNLPAFN